MLFSTTKMKSKGFMAYVWTLYIYEFQEGEIWNEIPEKSKKVILFLSILMEKERKKQPFSIFSMILLYCDTKLLALNYFI